MRSGVTNGLIVLARSCSALPALRAGRPRAIGFPGRAQVGPVARLRWSDRPTADEGLRLLPQLELRCSILRESTGVRLGAMRRAWLKALCTATRVRPLRAGTENH
jgi:hypothetical protein